MISLAQTDFSEISLCFVLSHKAQKHTLRVLFCLYGGNVTLLIIMRVYQQIWIQNETGIFDDLSWETTCWSL
jgi:hypothetical protein